MRVIALFLLATTLAFSEEFPKVFSSAGDAIYKDLGKYLKIKDLAIYAEKPEFLGSFCKDANASMQRGFSLDKLQKDPEAIVDKELIKSYARELRQLASQNEAIKYQLRRDIDKLHEEKAYDSLAVIRDADIELSQEVLQAINAHEKKRKQEEALAIVIAKSKEEKKETAQAEQGKPAVLKSVEEKAAVQEEENEIRKPNEVSVPTSAIEAAPVQIALVETTVQDDPKTVEEEMPAAVEEKKELTKLEYYEENLVRLKEELYILREGGDQEKMACLNDITAINYWMIEMLKNESDPCLARDAIKQMKSYDKSSIDSCGRDSIRYMEWHGRIKPYVGTTLFKAEAACNR